MSKQVILLSMQRAYLFAARGVCEAEPGLNSMPERVGLSGGNCTLCLGVDGLLGVSEACTQPDGEGGAISSEGSRVFCLII